MMQVFDISQVHKNRQDHVLRNGYFCVKIKIIKYTVIFFVFAHSDVNKPNTHGQQSGTSEGEALSPCITQK